MVGRPWASVLTLHCVLKVNSEYTLPTGVPKRRMNVTKSTCTCVRGDVVMPRRTGVDAEGALGFNLDCARTGVVCAEPGVLSAARAAQDPAGAGVWGASSGVGPSGIPCLPGVKPGGVTALAGAAAAAERSTE
jgi:hypothetical protein